MFEQEENKTQSSIVEIMELLQKVPTDTPEAELNESTMVDHNGNRVKY